MCFSIFTLNSIHSIQRRQELDDRRFKSQTRERNRVDKSRILWKKKKAVQKKKLIDASYESYIETAVAEQF